MKTSLYLSILLLSIASCSPKVSEPTASEADKYTSAMAKEHKEDAPIANNAWMEPELPVDTARVEYATINDKRIEGYLAKPLNAQAGTLPGVLMIHEWWGLNDNIKMMARRMAAEGYVVLAVDLYEGTVAQTPQEAQTSMRGLMNTPENGEKNMIQAFAFLREQENAPKIGVMGWCMGGAWTLTTSMLLPNEITAANLYYGRVETNPDKLAPLSMPVLGIFGAEDRGIPVEGVKRFETVMDSLGKSVEIHIYEGAGHGFANPSGRAYDVEAASDAWLKTLRFFKTYLKE